MGIRSGMHRRLETTGTVTRVRRGTIARGVAALACALALLGALAGCGPFGGGGTVSTTTVPGLSSLPWCDTPALNFVDDSTQAQTPINDWSQVKPQLGFTLYLPKTLPKGSCLVLAGGSVHDPIYGAHVSLTWDVAPAMTPLSFSEAPRRGAASKPQCEASAQDAKMSICLGSVKDTSVTIVANQSPAQLESLFNALQPDVEWLPSDTQKLLAAPSPTGQSS